MIAAAGRGLWHRIGSQLADPSGPAGRATGWLMGYLNRAPTRLVQDALGLRPGHSLLDVGCGAGQALQSSLPHCREAFGIDRSQTMVTAARHRNRVAIAAGRCRISAGLAEALPFPDDRFDRVMASNILYFWDDVPAVLAELRRVLRPGGRIVLYITDARSMRNWAFARTGTHRLYEKEELEGLLRSATPGTLAVTVEEVPLLGGVRGLVAILDECRGSTVAPPAPRELEMD